MNKKCFGDCGSKCLALTRKNCAGCRFYKERDKAIKELKMSPNFHIDKDLQKIAISWGA